MLKDWECSSKTVGIKECLMLSYLFTDSITLM